MNESRMLEVHERRVKRRLQGNLQSIHDELERIVGPTVREYPRTGIVAGASVGFVAGRIAGAAVGGGRSVAAGLGTLVRGTGIAALRSALLGVFDGAEEAAAAEHLVGEE